MRIFKYRLPQAAQFVLELPKGAKILSCQTQGYRAPELWTLVDPNAPLEKRTFLLVATGEVLPKDFLDHVCYLSTVQVEGGASVYHVFERLDEAPLPRTPEDIRFY